MAKKVTDDMLFKTTVMQEMGLEEGEHRRVVDQDTGEICCVGTKDIVMPGCQSGKSAVEFDPRNPRIMNQLFMNFVDKLEEEGDIDGGGIASYGTYNVPRSDKVKAKAVFNDGSIMESKGYKNEGLCYVDLVYQINGEEGVNLDEFDKEVKKDPIKGIKPITKRNTKTKS